MTRPAAVLLPMFLVPAAAVAVAAAAAAPSPSRAAAPRYKCLFNHELLIVSHTRDNSREAIQAFIDKLAPTDVDAVMCCPTMWRTNLFPSEVDPGWKRYSPDQAPSRFRSYDHIMRYLKAGGDPVRDTLDACRRWGKAFFISYRMNDHHHVTDRAWPTHNAFWREHPEYWLGDSDTSPYTLRDNVRLFNYLRPEVRDHYFAILEELCTKYDVDGVELDFQRFPRFFPSAALAEGTAVMTAFVGRIRAMLDRVGRERARPLLLCARVPATPKQCAEAGLDLPGWDRARLLDMINVSSFYIQTMELDIEGFQARTRHARIYGEMNYVTSQKSAARPIRRYTTRETYWAAALNLLHRGADGFSLFNFDYVPAPQRIPMTATLQGITDVEQLRARPKNYVVTPGFGTFPATDSKAFEVIIPDDTGRVKFDRAALRVETRRPCADLRIDVRLNGQSLAPFAPEETELFPPLARNEAYPERAALKFYTVPPARIVAGPNRVEIENLDREKSACQFRSLEIALYR